MQRQYTLEPSISHRPDAVIHVISRYSKEMHALMQLAKYFIAGGVAFGINISALYLLTDVVHIYYLASSVCAFLISFTASFLLQRYWTFKGSSSEWHKELPPYLALQLANLLCNTSLMYVFVEFFGVWYIASQTIISVALAFVTFTIAKLFIFRSHLEPEAV